jgi:hypothetical protein
MRIVVVRALAAAASWLLLLSPAFPQAIPIGPDFTVGGDLDLSYCVKAAIDDDRWFVASFVTAFSFTPDAIGFSDRAEPQGWQLLDGFGHTWWSERPIDIAAVGVDDFMAVWETNPSEPWTEETFVRGRRISAHAVLLTDPFEVARGELHRPRDPRVAPLPSSRIVVAWVDDSSDGTDNSGTSIQARLFTIDGLPLGPRFQVNTTTAGNQTMPDVSAAPDGDFAVTWQSESSSGNDDSGTSVQLRRFDGDGLPIGTDRQVNTYTNSDQSRPRVACGGNDRIAVVWESDGSSGDDDASTSVQARVFDGDGVPLGADLQVNSYVLGAQTEPAVAAMADGSFEVVWASDGSPGDDDSYSSIQRRAFNADGGSIGDQLQVNTLILYSQWAPDIAMNAEGDFVVVWDDVLTGLRGRIYRRPLLADGFESGDTSAWGAAVP